MEVEVGGRRMEVEVEWWCSKLWITTEKMISTMRSYMKPDKNRPDDVRTNGDAPCALTWHL